MSASRAAGTTYTNSTGKPIFVYIVFGLAPNCTLTVSGVTTSGANSYSTSCFIVPNGGTYSVGATNGANSWLELR